MSAISTYNGPRSAKERAAIAWGTAHGDRLHEQEQQRHERLIQATRRIAPKPEPRVSRFESGDTQFWREAQDENLRRENERLRREIERIRRCRK